MPTCPACHKTISFRVAFWPILSSYLSSPYWGPPIPIKIQCPYCKTQLRITTPTENRLDASTLDIPVFIFAVWYLFKIEGMTTLEGWATLFILLAAAMFTDYLEYKYYEVLTLIPPQKM